MATQPDLSPGKLWRPAWLFEIPRLSVLCGYRFVAIPSLAELCWRHRADPFDYASCPLGGLPLLHYA